MTTPPSNHEKSWEIQTFRINFYYLPMAKKPPRQKSESMLESSVTATKEMWINPRSTLRGPAGNRAWDHQQIGNPNSGARFLELADIALGLKRPQLSRKKQPSSNGTHETGKTEPYSR